MHKFTFNIFFYHISPTYFGVLYTPSSGRTSYYLHKTIYSGADKSLARPGRKQSTATEDFDVHISYLLSWLGEY
jgi:hypothetical protein